MTDLFAEVIVDISLGGEDKSFSYRVKDAQREDICIGSAVRIPFGGRRMVTGCVIGLSDRTDCPADRIRDIEEVLTSESIVESDLVRLALWMRQRYGSTLTRCLHTVLPWRKKVREVVEKTVSLTVPEEEARAYLAECQRTGRRAQERLLTCFLEKGETQASRLLKETDTTASVLASLEKRGILAVSQKRLFRGGTEAEGPAEAGPALSGDQQAACTFIEEEWQEDGRPVLLYGVTGSGKTLVYMEMIDRILKEGKQAIVLIPEIALTYQTVSRFTRRFGSVVSFLHSRLSDGERYDQFQAARRGDIRIMVGPRSALFTPFADLGLIVVDEEHEKTYASEISPRYQAVETAIERGKLSGTHVILGSATPSLESFTACLEGRIKLVELTERYGRSILPETVLVDMKKELREGCRSLISRPLKNEIAKRLERGEQSLLFLNRRGLTACVTCRSCGHVEKCPHCDVSLTEHRSGKLVCHYCGYEKNAVRICPSCGSHLIGGIRAGTEMVEDLLLKAFPKARILRMDMDTTRGKTGHEDILRTFAEGRADILIGTQMIVKGHDFPNVTLVGILIADMSLNMSDYRAGERTFQLVTQAVGRCGRADKKGLALIQTYDPDHYSLRTAADQDYQAFYREEMVFRRMMHYPPCGNMLAILGSGPSEEKLDEAMDYLRKFIDRLDPDHHLSAIGPAPQSVGKIRDTYRRVIYLRHEESSLLEEARSRIEKYIEANRGFEALTIQFDRNQ